MFQVVNPVEALYMHLNIKLLTMSSKWQSLHNGGVKISRFVKKKVKVKRGRKEEKYSSPGIGEQEKS